MHKYALAYTTADNGVRSLLSSITETGKDEDTGTTFSLPPTQFTYQHAGEYWPEDANYTIPTGILDINSQDAGVRVTDVNGDGLPDLLLSRTGSSTTAFLNNGDGTGWTEASSSVPVYFIDTDLVNRDRGVRIADVNGDGLPDLIQGKGASSTLEHVYINNGYGTGWNLDANYVVPVDFVDTNNVDQAVRIADVNGDGLPDLFQSKDVGPQRHVYINKGDGTGWAEDANYTYPSIGFLDSSGLDSGLRLADVNADGLADLVQSRDLAGGSTVRHVWINKGGTG